MMRSKHLIDYLVFTLLFLLGLMVGVKKIRGLNPPSGESTLTPSFCIWRNAYESKVGGRLEFINCPMRETYH